MAVCTFFLRGQCKFGDKCRNEHPPGEQRQGGFGSQTWSNPNRTNNAAASSAKLPLPFSVDVIKSDLTPLMDKPIWPLSSYGPAKHEPILLGGLDESPEELRVRAATAKQSGNFNEYATYEVNKIAAAEQVYANARDNLAQVYEQASKQSSHSALFAASEAGPSTTTVTTSAFGTPSAFGAPASAPSAFGSAAVTTSAFGGNSAFGQPAFGQSAFGQSTAPTTSALGQPSQPTSVFGQPTPAQPISAFGQPAAQQPVSAFGQPAASAFGQPAAQPPTSVFGQPAARPATSVFGQVPSQQPISAFGQASQPASSLIKPATGAFGALASTGTANAFGGGGFSAFSGQPSAFGSGAATTAAPQTTSGSVFGQPAFGTTPAAPATASVFGAPVQPTSAFGAPSAFGQTQTAPVTSAFGTPAFGATATPSAFNTGGVAPSNAFSNPSNHVSSPFASQSTLSVPSAFGEPQKSMSALSQAPLSAFPMASPSTSTSTSSAFPLVNSAFPSSSSFSSAFSSTPDKPKTVDMVAAFANLQTAYKPNLTPYDQQLPPNYMQLIPPAALEAFQSQKFEWGKVPDWVPPLELR